LVRIAGTRTRRIALSLSLFNILILISRTSNSFQAPLLAKRVEQNIAHGAVAGATSDFRWLLAAASIATIAGAVLIPTFQRLFERYVEAFGRHRAVSRLALRLFSSRAVSVVRHAVAIPRWNNIAAAGRGSHIPWSVALLNTAAMAIWTVGVFAALYAAYLRPELRVTSSQLSAVVNGAATILMFVFIDPYLSMVTDDVAEGRLDEPYFRRSIVWLTGSRLAGTVLAQALLVPAALWIVAIAERL
jgi:Alternate to MurJ